MTNIGAVAVDTGGTTALPGLDDVGEHGVWLLPDDASGAVDVEGYFLGVATSRRPGHNSNHPGRPYADPARRERCSACRWIELRLFVETETAVRAYVLHKIGASSVPGEAQRHSRTRLVSPPEVLEVLLTKQPGDLPAVLTEPARRVIAQGASFDDGIATLYYDWNHRGRRGLV
jgi:hypothetical protein